MSDDAVSFAIVFVPLLVMGIAALWYIAHFDDDDDDCDPLDPSAPGDLLGRLRARRAADLVGGPTMSRPEIHTIPVPRGWSVELAWEAIRRGALLTDPEPQAWANIEVVDNRLVKVLP